MNIPSEETSYFSAICIEQCKGLCCDPWWGIISYTVVKDGGLSNLATFREEIIRGIKVREQRIREAYVTTEARPRPLFDRPDRYNAFVRDVKYMGNSLHITIMAMYAFRCLYLSEDKVCAIHPSVTGTKDIRPPHCGYMGSPEARLGEKGYCRIIHAAVAPVNVGAVAEAIKVEKGASEKHYAEGVPSAEMAADNVISQLKAHHAAHVPPAQPRAKATVPGRNDPCHCGSGLKYKKCHGR